MKIILNEAQSKILIDIALKDLLPKELERRKEIAKNESKEKLQKRAPLD
jgi:hypothetical protein